LFGYQRIGYTEISKSAVSLPLKNLLLNTTHANAIASANTMKRIPVS